MSKKNVKLKVESGKWWTLLLLSIFHFPLSIFNSYAYEVSSLSTSSSPVFIKTQDGSADLTYPVASENTFGSPDWYEELSGVTAVTGWKVVVGDNVVSNASGNGLAYDRYHAFNLPPNRVFPDSSVSRWCLEYDLNDSNFFQDLWRYAIFPGMSTNNPGIGIVDSQYDDPSRIPVVDASGGPGTIEFGFYYYNAADEYVYDIATMFPARSDENIWPIDYAYPNADPPVEIWLPKFQRLTPASRSALIAAYEAYFERMYYGSKGVTDSGEDEDEWSLWQLGSPDADADFIFRAPPFWNTNDQHSAKLLDAFHYPESAYYDPTNSPSARRHYPSWCFRLMDEATNVARLAYSMRKISPFAVQSGWLGHGAIPDETLRNETPFLVRPQWLLDGRTVPGHYTAVNCEYSYLWWSSQVDPPAVEQLLDPERSDETYIPDFSSVFPEISSPQYYAEDAITDSYIPYKANEDLVKNIRPAQYAFTLSTLEGDDVFIQGFEAYPVQTLFKMIFDAMDTGYSTHWSFQSAVDYMYGYRADGLTVPGFVTNCVRQAARSLPLRSDAMDAYSARLAETSETFRVDSGPIAAASHVLGLMDRTFHIPNQEFVCTNWVVTGVSGGNYRGEISEGEATNVILLTEMKHTEDGSELGFVPDGKPTSFTVRNARTNVVEKCVDNLETKATDCSIRMFAREPYAIPEPDKLISVGAIAENLPHKSFKVGEAAVNVSGGPISDGDWALAGPVRWHGPIGDHSLAFGPDVQLNPKDESIEPTYSYVLTHDPSNYVPRVIINRCPYHDSLAMYRGYTFRDKDAVEFGTTLGPVQVGVTPDKGDASHHAGILLGGSVDSTDEHGNSRSYDFLSAFKTDATARSGLISWIDGKADDLSATLSDRIKDTNRRGLRDPRKPGEYAPMPEWYEQQATVVVDELNDHVLALKVDAESIRLTKTETFPEGTADKYVFDVETWVKSTGFVDYVCETGRSVTVVGEVDEYWHLVDYYADVWNLDHAVTNITRNEDSGGSGYTYKVRDETILSTITTEVARVVMSGDTNLLTAVRTVSTNVTHTTAFDSSESYQSEFNVTVWREDPTFGYYYEYDTRRDTDSGNRPWPIPPIVNKAVTNSMETVELNPADAKSHETVQVGGTYTYTPIISVTDGKVTRISFESPNPSAPSIPDSDEFVVANEMVEGEVLNHWAEAWFEYSAITNNAPTNAVWHGSFDGAARPAVMTWTDWTWNALKRD